MKFISMFILLASTVQLFMLSARADDNFTGKVVGGVDTDIRDVPYQVSIRLTKKEKQRYGSGHICGGVVLSRRMVGTAAHCLYGVTTNRYRTAGEYILVMGSSYLNSGTSATLHFHVQQITMHPNFNPRNLHNDIGVFFINGFIPWDSFVRPLPIASKQMATKTECLISGWGATKTAGSANNMLQSAKIFIIEQKTCSESYGDIPYTQICAGIVNIGGVDSCQGDSGGPMQCLNVLVGIVSYGRECAEKKYPGVYTNVVQYQDWLNRVNDTFDYSVYRSGAVQITVISYYMLWLKNLCILFIAARY